MSGLVLNAFASNTVNRESSEMTRFVDITDIEKNKSDSKKLHEYFRKLRLVDGMNLVRQCNRLAREAVSSSSAGDVQGWMGFEQPDQVEGIPAHRKGMELGD